MSEHPLRSRLREFYFGHTQKAIRFQGVLLVLDILIIGFFIGSRFIAEQDWFWVVDAAITVFLAADLIARLVAFGTLQRWLKFPSTWIDLVVLATLLFPAMLHNWGFLRILRLWTLVHSERFWNVLARGRYDDTYVEDLSKAITTLFVFIFMAAGFALAVFAGQHPKLNNFIDAMYFVVTSLTTTGYGDITIDTAAGRMFSIVLMIAGVSLFFSIAQKAFAPQGRIVACSSCGIDRHERDARFCRGCGEELPLRGERKRVKASGEEGG